MHMHANMHQFPLCAFRRVCVCFLSLQLCETSCVCLLYLVYLLQESRLSAAAPSHHIHLSEPCHHQEDSMSSLGITITGSTARPLHVEGGVYVAVCVFSVHVAICSISFSSIWPVVHVDSTCVHLLVYLLQESRLSATEQSLDISSADSHRSMIVNTNHNLYLFLYLFCPNYKHFFL